MADTKWTKEQERAISDRGKGIIVSAAAGSGKTTVLIAVSYTHLTLPTILLV